MSWKKCLNSLGEKSDILSKTFGYVINNPSLGNLGIVLSGTGFLIMRIRYEEALLFGYKDYVSYANRTRWRLMPSIW